jgi:periplasmic protein TonB
LELYQAFREIAALSLQKFFVYSIAAHALILLALLILMPAEQEKNKGDEFFTRLVSPDEVPSRKPLPLSVPRVRPIPSVPRGSAPAAPAPSPGVRDTGKAGDVRESPSPHAAPPSGRDSGKTPEKETAGRRGAPAPDTRGIPLRDKLFDKSIIGDMAKREVEKKEKEQKDTTFTFDAREYKFLLYNRRLKERIESIWVYPPDAAAQGIYGDLILRFTIKKDGKIGAVELVRTSGHKNLDDSAMRALRDGSPFWPLPDEWGMDSYTIEGHFVYTIYGYYLR